MSSLLGLAVVGSGVTGCGGSGSAGLPPSVAMSTNSSARQFDTKNPSALRVTPLASQSAYAEAVAGAHPVAYYQLADATTTLVDSGPNAIGGKYGAGVVRNAAAITLGAAAAAAFPGGAAYNSAGYAFAPKTGALQAAHPTLEVWLRMNAPNATNHDLPVVVYGSVGRGVRYGLFIHGLGNGAQCLQIQERNAGKGALVANLTSVRFAVNQTYHVVVSSDGTNLTTYVNGVASGTLAYPGSVDYSSYFTDGIQIGGADQGAGWGSASFPGTIAQAAIYSSPLSAASVTAHFLAGQLIPMVTETPANSDTFVNSFGINAHFDNPESIYGTQFAQVKNLLVASGIRHVRESVAYNNAGYLSAMQQLAASGVHASYVTNLRMTQAQVQQWPGLVGASFEQYEAPNELDDVGNANWLPATIAFQKNLYGWVKSDPQIAKYPVLGPSIVKMPDFAALGNLSAYMDDGNIHDYFDVYNPGTYGWGGTYPPYGVYGSIAFNVNLGRVVSGSKPIVATETGYSTIAGNPLTLDYKTQLRYITRLFFEQFNNGIVRSYPYEFMDEGGSALFNNCGLVTTSLQPKPAYYGIKSITAALADPGAPFAATPLQYHLTGFVDSVHHTLLEKRNGHYVLAVWLEVPSWVTLGNLGGDITIPAQTVTLTTAKTFASAAMTTLDETGSLDATPISWSGTSAQIPVTDKISLIDLGP